MTQYLFRLDDIAPNMDWQRYSAVCELFDRYGIKPLLGVIPDNQDPELLNYQKVPVDFWEHIRCQCKRGWDLALHGHQHKLNSLNSGILAINRHSEFAGLSLDLQTEKLWAGLEIFKKHGLQSSTFMPPAHGYDNNTLKAMGEVGLTMLTDGHALYPFRQEGILCVPQLFAMPRRMPFGVYTFCLHTNLLKSSHLKSIEEFLKRNYKAVLPFSQVPTKHWFSFRPSLPERFLLTNFLGYLRRKTR